VVRSNEGVTTVAASGQVRVWGLSEGRPSPSIEEVEGRGVESNQ
jgi:hypothetical protein